VAVDLAICNFIAICRFCFFTVTNSFLQTSGFPPGVAGGSRSILAAGEEQAVSPQILMWGSFACCHFFAGVTSACGTPGFCTSTQGLHFIVHEKQGVRTSPFFIWSSSSRICARGCGKRLAPLKTSRERIGWIALPDAMDLLDGQLSLVDVLIFRRIRAPHALMLYMLPQVFRHGVMSCA